MKKNVIRYSILCLSATISSFAAGVEKSAGSIEEELYQAIEGNRPTILKKLLDEHAELKNNLSAALIQAAIRGNRDIVVLLLEAGTAIDARSVDEGSTALMFAAENGHKDVVDLLLEKGAQVDIKNKWEMTALIYAAQHGHREVVDLLLRNGAHANIKNTFGDTALIHAVFKGHQEIVALLLRHGVHVDIQNKSGDTALIQAALKGYLQIAELLIENGADINISNKKGFTPLIMAAKEGHQDIVELLLKNGADANSATRSGRTAFMWAGLKEHKKIAELLLKNGADFNNIQVDLNDEAITREPSWLAKALDDLIISKQFNTEQAPELLDIVNSNKNDDAAFQLLVQRTIALVKKYETAKNSVEYRNAARILYTAARRIAQDYIKSLGTKTFQAGKVLLEELEIPIFIASYNPALVSLHITNTRGQDESFVHIVEENIDRLMPK